VKTRTVLGSIFASIAVLVIGWQAGNAATIAASQASASATTGGATGAASTDSTAGSTTSSTGSTSSKSKSKSTSSSSSASSKDGTYNGTTVQTEFGPMQVAIVVSNGKISDVKPLQLTNADGRSQQISNYAVPILRSEVLSAQSAKVASVGGATYTSDGYLQSLQSAIDKAGL
jgi:uncharacterized protein with FMN-binding domain